MDSSSSRASVGAALRFARRRIGRAVGAYGWRGAGLALANIRGGTRLRRVPVPGRRFRLEARLGRAESDLQTLISVFHGGDYDFLTQQPKWVIDAGANAGYSAVWFADRYPEAQVIAVEPDPGNFELLRRNTAGWANVTVVKAALMGYDGDAQLVDPLKGPWAIRVQREAAPWSQGRVGPSVRCATVESLLTRFQIPRIDLLKLDIEGSEVDMLTDCDAWIPRVEAVVAELHDRFRVGCSAAFEQATASFPIRRARGENVFVSRGSDG